MSNCHFPGQVDITLNHTRISSKMNKSIKMHGEWAITFADTKAAILYAYPHRSQEFSEYEKFVVGQFAAFIDPSQHQQIILDCAI